MRVAERKIKYVYDYRGGQERYRSIHINASHVSAGKKGKEEEMGNAVAAHVSAGDSVIETEIS